MNWRVAIHTAQRFMSDMTYEEWCGLYVPTVNPTVEEVKSALRVAKPILVRKNVVRKTTFFKIDLPYPEEPITFDPDSQ